MNQLYTPSHQDPIVLFVYGLFIVIVVLAVVV